MNRSHHKKSSWDDDPYVLIHPMRLRATIDARNWTVQGVARAIGCASQALDPQCRGEIPKRMRRQRRAALAKVLRVPVGWLEGSELILPNLLRFDRRLTLPLSPRLQLAVGDLLAQSEAAIRRDMETPEIQEMKYPFKPVAETVSGFFAWTLLRLLRLDVWREQLTTWRHTEPSPFAFSAAPGMLKDHPDLYTPEEDSFGLAMVTAWSAILRPWFEGKAALDYNRLRVLNGYDRLGEDPHGASHPLYLGKAASPLNLDPATALGWPSWFKQ